MFADFENPCGVKIIVCDVSDAWGQPGNDEGQAGKAGDKFRKI